MATSDRGFASMDPEKQREIAGKGGRAAHQKGTAYKWSSAEAREAGRRGVAARERNRRLARQAATQELAEALADSERADPDALLPRDGTDG